MTFLFLMLERNKAVQRWSPKFGERRLDGTY